MLNSGYELVPVVKLKEHPRNPNRGNVAKIVESIKANGFFGACIVQTSTNYILAGNHRFRGAKQAGLTEVPVIWVDCDDATAHRIILADNQTTRQGKDDPESLLSLLQDVQRESSSLLGTGYDDGVVDKLLKQLSREEFAFVDKFGSADDADDSDDDSDDGPPIDFALDEPQEPPKEERVSLSIVLGAEDFDKWRQLRKARGCVTDTELLLQLLVGA